MCCLFLKIFRRLNEFKVIENLTNLLVPHNMQSKKLADFIFSSPEHKFRKSYCYRGAGIRIGCFGSSFFFKNPYLFSPWMDSFDTCTVADIGPKF